MKLKPQHDIKEIARQRGLAVRDQDNMAGRVLFVPLRRAALYIIGQGIIPLRYHPDGSITFPDQDGRASMAYDRYLTYIHR